VSTNMPPSQSRTELIEAAWTEFVTFLRQSGARITSSRKTIFEHILRRKDHFRADEVAEALAHGRNRVSRGTVYRTLALMVEYGLIRQIRDSDTHVHYEQTLGQPHHEHMICEDCGAFIEFDDDEINRLLQAACDRIGFAQNTHRVVVFGRCATCQKKPQKRKTHHT